MFLRPLAFTRATALIVLLWTVGCAPGVGGGTDAGTTTGSGGGTSAGTGGNGSGTGGRATGSGGSAVGTGGTFTGTGGAANGTGGAAPGTGGTVAGTGGSATGTGGAMTGTGGTPTGSGGTATGGRGGATATGGRGTGGATPTGGTTSTGGSGAGGSTTVATPLDCGAMGWAVENHGPPANRLNYVIIGDGYTSAQLAAGGLFEQHINTAHAKRYSAVIGQPFGRYRNFVNICAIKIPSTAICGSSALGCCGSDSSRLANCDSAKVTSALNANVPSSFMIDWRAVVLNGSSWWNTGGALMLWSGGHADASGAALHEGGHGHNQLADEYGDCTGAGCGSNTNFSGSSGSVYAEVNSCGNPTTTDGKWDMWMGFTQTGATGLQGTWSGSRYVGTGQYRPSANSMMNSLFGNNVNTSFNAPSRENVVFTIWRAVKPIDSVEPAAGAANNPAMLKVNVVDPAVISVDWTVDGTTTVNGGTTFSTASLAAGSHTISAKAYDNAGMDLVRYKTSTCPSSVTGNYCSRTAWKNSEQTVMWTVTK